MKKSKAEKKSTLHYAVEALNVINMLQKENKELREKYEKREDAIHNLLDSKEAVESKLEHEKMYSNSCNIKIQEARLRIKELEEAAKEVISSLHHNGYINIEERIKKLEQTLNK